MEEGEVASDAEPKRMSAATAPVVTVGAVVETKRCEDADFCDRRDSKAVAPAVADGAAVADANIDKVEEKVDLLAQKEKHGGIRELKDAGLEKSGVSEAENEEKRVTGKEEVRTEDVVMKEGDDGVDKLPDQQQLEEELVPAVVEEESGGDGVLKGLSDHDMSAVEQKEEASLVENEVFPLSARSPEMKEPGKVVADEEKGQKVAYVESYHAMENLGVNGEQGKATLVVDAEAAKEEVANGDEFDNEAAKEEIDNGAAKEEVANEDRIDNGVAKIEMANRDKIDNEASAMEEEMATEDKVEEVQRSGFDLEMMAPEGAAVDGSLVQSGSGESAIRKSNCEDVQLNAMAEKPGASLAVQPGLLGDADVQVNNCEDVNLNLVAEKPSVDTDVLLQAGSVEANVRENNCKDPTLSLMLEKPQIDDKGKGIAFEVPEKQDYVNEDSSGLEGPSGRGFNLVFQPAIGQAETSQRTGASTSKEVDDELKMGTLDLSLSLPGRLEPHDYNLSVQRPNSSTRATSFQPAPSSSFRTSSEGFTASMSFTNSQTFVHNQSCSLTQQSSDDFEQSVKSKPIFHAVEQPGGGTIWQPQLSNERKAGDAPLLHRVLQNGQASHSSFVAMNGHLNGMLNGPQRPAGSPGQISPTGSLGSHDSRLERRIDRRQLTKERSSSSLLRSEGQEAEQLVLNGAGVIEKVISKIICEPLHLTARMLREMTEHSVAYLRESISEMIISTVTTGQIVALQEALHSRSDLTMENLQRCPRVLLEILVAIRTGVPDYIKKNVSITTPELIEVFLNLRCRNLACRNMLSVDDCDCKICQQKSGFCISCMCIVCSKFDTALNTCSWVGCDICPHWCHTDCALRHSLIRSGGSSSEPYRSNEMQFHCAACERPSEMFGFVKAVFLTCAKEWKLETLVRELQYVARIFYSSVDARGKRLWNLTNQLVVQLGDRANHPEVVKQIIAFFSDAESNIDIIHSVPQGTSGCIHEASNGIPSSSSEMARVQLQKASFLESYGTHPSLGSKLIGRETGELRAMEKKPVIDELDSLIRLKQAEAQLYQERANDARKEAESLQHIAIAKKSQIDEDYSSRVAKISLAEAEGRRKQKIQEQQLIERAHQQYINMKSRMEANIRELLLKMEATKHNFST